MRYVYIFYIENDFLLFMNILTKHIYFTVDMLLAITKFHKYTQFTHSIYKQHPRYMFLPKNKRIKLNNSIHTNKH